jgi:spermidine/putrescine transport system substrate-binding protein
VGKAKDEMAGRAEPRGGVAAAALAVAAVAIAVGLAGCGGSDDGGATTAKVGPVTGRLLISNWPANIEPGNGDTVTQFEEHSTVGVDYSEEIAENEAFLERLEPLLEEGRPGKRSVLIVSAWAANQLHDLGLLQDIDHRDLPIAFKNLEPSLRHPATDPAREFSLPWQTGMTGIWVDSAKAPGIHSVNDLFDPKYKGRVTMLAELRETVPLVMLAEGVDPSSATTDEWLHAIERIKVAAGSGQIRRFTKNDYTDDLAGGNIVAALGRSGNASLLGNPDAEWRMPSEGCSLWSAEMVIPVGAPNTAAALGWMNFVYKTNIAADLTEYVEEVSPVQGVQELLEQRGSPLAKDPLVFPSAKLTRNCAEQASPPDPEAVEEAWRSAIR